MPEFSSRLGELIVKTLGEDAADIEGVVFGCTSGSGFLSSDYAAATQITGFQLEAGRLVLEVGLRRFVGGNLLCLEYDEPHDRWLAVVDYPGSKEEKYPVLLETM